MNGVWRKLATALDEEIKWNFHTAFITKAIDLDRFFPPEFRADPTFCTLKLTNRASD